MGKKPDEIQREIEQHRERVGQRMGNLQGRVQDDIKSVKSVMNEGASGIAGRTSESLDLRSHFSEHPYTAVAGGLGLGVLLGITSEGLMKGGKGNGNASSSSGGNRNGAASGGSGTEASFLAGAMGTLTAAAGEVFKDELRQFVRGGLDGNQAARPEGPRREPRPYRPA